MRIEKHIKEEVTCDVCGKDITHEERQHYAVYDVAENKNAYLEIRVYDPPSKSNRVDMCELCKAKALLLGIIRRWKLDRELYRKFSTEKDTVGMDSFIQRIIYSKWGHGVDWIRAAWIRE